MSCGGELVDVTLDNGKWTSAEGPQRGIIEGSGVTYADLTGDGREEAMVDFGCTVGAGSTVTFQVVVMTMTDSGVTQLGQTLFGFDPVPGDGGLLIDSAHFEPDDPRCCPSRFFRTLYLLRNSAWNEDYTIEVTEEHAPAEVEEPPTTVPAPTTPVATLSLYIRPATDDVDGLVQFLMDHYVEHPPVKLDLTIEGDGERLDDEIQFDAWWHDDGLFYIVICNDVYGIDTDDPWSGCLRQVVIQFNGVPAETYTENGLFFLRGNFIVESIDIENYEPEGDTDESAAVISRISLTAVS